jgi:hypothetical protein
VFATTLATSNNAATNRNIFVDMGDFSFLIVDDAMRWATTGFVPTVRDKVYTFYYSPDPLILPMEIFVLSLILEMHKEVIRLRNEIEN